MQAFDAVAEQRIREAEVRGEFAGLPGAGRPLELDDDLLVPAELRMAYRILKNAGYVPPEVEALREIGELQQLLQRLGEGESRTLAERKLQLLSLRLGASRGGNLQLEGDYYTKIAERIARP